MKAAKRRDVRKITVRFRFWFSGKVVQVALFDGEWHRFHRHERTDEGWRREDVSITLVDRQILQNWRTDEHDCDGRLTEYGEAFCLAHNRQQVRQHRQGFEKVSRIRFPAWTKSSSEQYDESAIAMGY